MPHSLPPFEGYPLKLDELSPDELRQKTHDVLSFRRIGAAVLVETMSYLAALQHDVAKQEGYDDAEEWLALHFDTLRLVQQEYRTTPATEELPDEPHP